MMMQFMWNAPPLSPHFIKYTTLGQLEAPTTHYINVFALPVIVLARH